MTAHVDTFARDNLPPRAQWPDFRFELPELKYPDRLNCVVELLDRWIAEGRGNAPCLISPNDTLSYAQLAERVNRIANVLRRLLGLVPGHRVVLRGPNGQMVVAAYLAVIKAGGVVVATMPLVRAKEIAYPIGKAQIRLALCDHRLAEEMHKARALAPDLERVVYWGSGAADALETLMARPGFENFAPCDTASDDVCLIAFTSGTTGEPKGTMHFHRDILATCDSYGRHVLRAESGIKILDGIGATEMLHIFIGSPEEEIRPGATGKPVPGYEARVVDADGKELEPNTIGRLAVRGPTGCRYLADKRQRQYVQDGWNITGDTYLMDADGYFWYQARSDDMIVSAGYNIAGPEVEAALLEHPAVAECGVVGAPDEERGQIVKAYVVLRGGHSGDAATTKVLQEHVKATIAPYKYPRTIEYVTQLPRTQTGKLQRFELRGMAADTASPKLAS